MPANEQEDFVSAADACALLGVKPATLYAYVSRGLVQSYRQGSRRQRLYRRSEIERLRALPDVPEPDDQPDLPHAASWVGDR